MTTAEKYLWELNNIIHSGQHANDPQLGTNVLRSILAFQIEVLEGAAKLACIACELSRTTVPVKEGERWLHKEAEGMHATTRMPCRCFASGIHDSVAVLRKELEKL